jgi:hypothetical protein
MLYIIGIVIVTVGPLVVSAAWRLGWLAGKRAGVVAATPRDLDELYAESRQGVTRG